MKNIAVSIILFTAACASQVGYHPKIIGNHENYETDRQSCMRLARQQETNNGLIGGAFGPIGILASEAESDTTQDERDKKAIAIIDNCMISKGYKLSQN